MPDISADLRDWDAVGFLGAADLCGLFPTTPWCEFAQRPMHGCECNGCLEWRGVERVAVRP